jgi:hypothetical protein
VKKQMSDDKRIKKDERNALLTIENICGVTCRRNTMLSITKVENLFNINEAGSIIVLGLDFTTMSLDQSKIESLGETIRMLPSIERFLITIPEDMTLPGWIKDLNSINALIISNSSLAVIPEFIKDFKNLKTLLLNGNRIKLLPEWILNLLELKDFNINSNFPDLELTQANIDILRALHEKNVKITDSIFTMHIELGLPLEQVKILRTIKNNLGHNIIKGQKIAKVDKPLTNQQLYRGAITLQVFNGKVAKMGINQFKLEELPEDFGKIDGIIYLTIELNNLLASLPESFGELKELKELDLSNNELTSLPESFVNLTSITKLNLSNNKFSTIPTQLWALEELSDLNLSDNPLSSEENTIIQKVPDLIRKYLRKKATIVVFISHAVIDFEPYRIKELVDYLEGQNEISQVFFCEEDLAGNIDEWMLNAVQKSQLILFIGTNKSVFNSPDCDNELQLADKFSIPVIPLKGKDVDWPDLAEKNLSRELGIEYDVDNFDTFCVDIYKYIYNFKRELNLMGKEERHTGMIDIYERFRLILDERLADITSKLEDLAGRISNIEKKF